MSLSLDIENEKKLRSSVISFFRLHTGKYFGIKTYDRVQYTLPTKLRAKVNSQCIDDKFNFINVRLLLTITKTYKVKHFIHIHTTVKTLFHTNSF